MEKAVTRFAPSPTGYIHIGNVRSAIYPYLLAKQTGGTFILRIEDTDQARYVEGATDLIKETLLWLGLNWDEGPDIGGPHAPYFQTERKSLYISWAKKLIAEGRAYADPTPSEKINTYRQEDTAKKIPYLYRNHRPETTTEWQEGIPIRFKSEPKDYTWTDEVMGELSAGPEVQDDIILIKKDGLPTYNFAHIIDDAEMGVTHVIRGQEYLSSMPNYLALYDALNIPRPKFVSLPHILAPQGNKKLSKRDGAKSVTDYREEGILPEAMLNYLACLGWNDGTEQEIYTMSELLQKFSLDRIQNSGARFDETKLLWTNGMWIRKIHDEEGNDILYSKISPDFWPESAQNYPEEYRKKVLNIIYDRLKSLSDLKPYTSYFFTEPTVDAALIKGNKILKKLSEDELSGLLNTASARLSAETDWSAENLQDVLNELLKTTGRKPAELFSLIRLAVSFAPFSPALNLTLEALGRDRTLARLNLAARSID
ncbi:glutamate--tRNA ligase [Candidatus Saccharibacteria bacterium]|nr:glutamate--tRNA ligase [Candidatus Saccharibacteria bacterium]